MSSTIPATVTGRLAGGQLDADAGLVYDGDGRFFDPALGLPLQPDPFGGAPEAPASLNRYAALGVSTLPTLGSVPGNGLSEAFESLWTNAAKSVTGWGVGKGAQSYLRHLHRSQRQFRQIVREIGHFRFRVSDEVIENLSDYGITSRIGRLSGRSFQRVVNASGIVSYIDVATGTGDDTVKYLRRMLGLAGINVDDAVEFVGASHIRTVVEKSPVGRAAGWLALSKTGQKVLDFSIGMGIDVGVQAVLDVGMLRRGELTEWQYAGRLSVAAGGSALSYFGGGIVASLIGGPAIIPALAIAIGYDLVLQPILFDIFGLNPK